MLSSANDLLLAGNSIARTYQWASGPEVGTVISTGSTPTCFDGGYCNWDGSPAANQLLVSQASDDKWSTSNTFSAFAIESGL